MSASWASSAARMLGRPRAARYSLASLRPRPNSARPAMSWSSSPHRASPPTMPGSLRLDPQTCLAPGQPFGATVAEAGKDLLLELPVLRLPKLRIDLDQRECITSRFADPLEVLHQPGELEVGEAALARVEDCALATDAEVLVGQREAVGGAGDRGHPRAPLLGLRVGEQDADARCPSAADPPAELVELGKSEAVGVLDQHHGGVGHVHAHLD